MRVERATYQLRRPTAHRSAGGEVGEDESTIFARRGSEVMRRGDGEMFFLGVWMGLRVWELVGAVRERRRGRQGTRQRPHRPRSLRS